jgi:CysZ protein
MNDFILGMRYILRGTKLLAQPGIRRFVVIPLIVNTLLFTGVIIYGAELISDLIKHLSQQWSWLEWIGWLLWPLFVIVVLTIVFFCFSILANLIAAPFNGFLAAAVEEKLTGIRAADNQGISALLREIVDALKAEAIKFAYFLVRALPLLLLFLIPLIQAVAPLLWVLFGAWMIALEYLDFPMSNHGKLFPEIRKTLGEHRAVAIGFGLSTLMMTMVPIINFIAMPAAVAGATSLWLDHIKDQ